MIARKKRRVQSGFNVENNMNVNSNKVINENILGGLPQNEISKGGAAAAVKKTPHMIRVGGLILVSVVGMADEWGLTEEQFRGLLAVLGVPTVPILPDREYVSVYPLEYALFVLGLPQAMRVQDNHNPAGRDLLVADLHFQTASLLYGTLTKEAIKERVRAMARAIGHNLPKTPKRSPAARRGTRKLLDN